MFLYQREGGRRGRLVVKTRNLKMFLSLGALCHSRPISLSYIAKWSKRSFKFNASPKNEEIVKHEELERQSVYILLVATDTSRGSRIDQNTLIFRSHCVFSNISGCIVDVVVVGFSSRSFGGRIERTFCELYSTSMMSLRSQTPFFGCNR